MSVRVLAGDCLVVLDTLEENSIDAVVTDPPYHFASIVKRFGAENAAPSKGGVYERSSRGFMGKTWDGGDIAFDPATWAKVLRVMKPGAHLVAFGAPKNYHRLACAIEDAGFEIRDSLMWVFGSGFPKSHNLPDGWGTALKPAYEPIVLARKPLSEGTVAANVLRWGTGALNIDATRIAGTEDTARSQGKDIKGGNWSGDGGRSNLVTGGGTGRWPANLCHDGSEEVLAGFPWSKGQQGDVRGTEKSRTGGENTNCYGEYGRVPFAKRDDTGSAARFFYCAKANKTDRANSKHPTVKPVSLMRWLIRLVTPPGGTALDLFAGSGTTGQAALEEGFDAVLIEREVEYLADIERRLELAKDDAPLLAL